MRGVLPGPMRSVLSGASAGSPSGADVIALHEIHLARAIIDYQVVSDPKGAR